MLNISCINRNFLILNSLRIKYLFVCVLSGAVKSDSLQHYRLQPVRLLCPQNSQCKNTGVGSHSLLQGIFPTQGLSPGLLHCRWILQHPATRKAQEYWNGQPIPSTGDLPDTGIEPSSPVLQADSLPVELPGKPIIFRLPIKESFS